MSVKKESVLERMKRVEREMEMDSDTEIETSDDSQSRGSTKKITKKFDTNNAKIAKTKSEIIDKSTNKSKIKRPSKVCESERVPKRNKKLRETYTVQENDEVDESDELSEGDDLTQSDDVLDDDAEDDDSEESDDSDDRVCVRLSPQKTDVCSTPKTHDEYNELISEMKQLPIGQLVQLREKMGHKMFTEVYHGHMSDSEKTPADLNTDGTTSSQKKATTKVKSKEGKFSSEKPLLHKDRPTELSSKREATRFRHVVQVQKRKTRDPRFDSTDEGFRDNIFRSNYSFIDGVRAREKQELQNECAEERDEEKQRQIKRDLRKIKREDAAQKRREERTAKVKVLKDKEKAKVKEGKRPFFIKKGDEKNMLLMEEFRRLKQEGRLDTYLKARRKRNAQKSRTKVPD